MAADVDGNGKPDVRDITELQRYLADIPSALDD